MLPAKRRDKLYTNNPPASVSGRVYPGSRPLLHIHICACKFRLNVKPAITTILPACRCRHRDETARDSGPGRSDKPGCNPTQTRPRGTTNHDPLEAKRLPQPAQNSHLVINVHGATFDLPTPDADVLELHTWQPNTANPVELRTTLQRLTVQFSGSKRRE